MRSLCRALLFIVCWFTGCGSPATVASGKVTLNGQPLASGMIQFLSGPGSETASMQIVNGDYSGPVAPGAKRVLVSAPKVIGKQKRFEGQPNGPERDATEEALPSRYNTKSELIAEIKPGPNQLNFELTTP